MRPKIALFTHSLKGGGAERVLSILLHHLAQDFELHLILLEADVVLPIPTGQTIHVLKGGDAGGLMKFIKIPLLAWRLRRYLKAQKIELIFSFLSRPNLIATSLKRWGWRGQIVISERTSTLHNYNPKTFQGRLMLALIRLQYPLAHLIVPNSKGIQAGLTDVLKIQNTYQVIYNPVDTANIAAQAHAPKPGAAFVFISVGNFFSYKNQALLIDAFAQLDAPHCQLWLVGEGTEEAALKARAQASGKADKITFWGFQPQPTLLMHQAHCFVLPSNIEGFPNVLLEALSCGLPIIATDCPTGPRELLAPDTDFRQRRTQGVEQATFGLLTPTHSVADLAAALAQIYENASLRHDYAAKAPQRAQDFDVKKIILIFKEMLHNRLKNSSLN